MAISANMRERAKKGKNRPRGSAQPVEKAQFGERNPRISFDLFWPDLAQFGSGSAEFGFG
jgi:hypothetical protein